MMDSRELFVSTLRMEHRGKVPLCLRDLTLGMDALGVPTDAVFGGSYDPELSAECVLALQREVGQDVTMGCISTYSLEAFGGETKYPPDGIPYASGYPFADIDRMDDFSPSDIIGPLLRGMRRSCEIVRKEREDLALAVNVPGPMTMAGFARNLETLMMDLIENPDIALRLSGFCTRAIEEEMRYLYDGIADAVYIASASDNPDMMGEEEFRRHSLSGVKRLTETAHGDGVPVVFHPHGVFSTEDRVSLLDDAVRTGADGFQFAESNDPAGIADVCRGRCAVLGGVNAYSTLLLGPDARIVRDTDRFLNALSDVNYIMTCSCSVNRGLPIENLKVMADELRRYNGGLE